MFSSIVTSPCRTTGTVLGSGVWLENICPVT